MHGIFLIIRYKLTAPIIEAIKPNALINIL